MADFDIAAGMSQSTLNAMLPQVYKALYPHFLKDSIQVNEVGISFVDFDIQSPPTVSLAPSATAKDHIATACDAHLAKAGTFKDTALAMASSATFSATASEVALTVNYSNGSSPTKVPSASLVAGATITVDGSDSDLTVKILCATINVTNNPVLTELLNKALVPYLITYLNTKFLSDIKIPPLGYKTLKFSAPLPVVQQPYVTAFSKLGSSTPAIPAPLPWPEDGVYIAADIPTLEAAAGLIFPLGTGEKSFSWKIFSGQVGANVKTPNISSINDDGSISATISAEAECQLKMDAGFFGHISFGPKATATAAWTLLPKVEGGKLELTGEGLPSFSFSFDWGIPDWINWMFEPLEAGLSVALNGVIGPLAASVLDNMYIPILQLPDIPLNFGGDIKINITIDNATAKGFNGNVLVTAQPTISK